jgi:hypothetical protein
MQKKPVQNEQQEIDGLLRDFGVKPNDETRDNLKTLLQQQRAKFVTIERMRGKNQERDISR